MWLYRWLVFNALTGNSDNHLKNISFMVSSEGVSIAPGYDLLSTAVYTTRVCADDRATWPYTALALPLPGAQTYAEITRAAVLMAGRMLGLAEDTAMRELDRLVRRILPAAGELIAEIGTENAKYPAELHAACAGDMRLLHSIRYIVLDEMVKRLKPVH